MVIDTGEEQWQPQLLFYIQTSICWINQANGLLINPPLPLYPLTLLNMHLTTKVSILGAAVKLMKAILLDLSYMTHSYVYTGCF